MIQINDYFTSNNMIFKVIARTNKTVTFKYGPYDTDLNGNDTTSYFGDKLTVRIIPFNDGKIVYEGVSLHNLIDKTDNITKNLFFKEFRSNICLVSVDDDNNWQLAE